MTEGFGRVASMVRGAGCGRIAERLPSGKRPARLSLVAALAWPGRMEFRFLGPLEVFVEDRRLELGGSKQRQLLAILLLHANQGVSADRLIDGLWGAKPPAQAAKGLQVPLSRLRK